MSITLAVLTGVLFAVGTYLLLHRTLTRLVIAVGVFGNGVNLLIVSAGGRAGDVPIIGRDGDPTDPVPQALVLTGIVIGFALQAFLLALAWRNWTIDGNDEVEDDLEDRRLAARSAAEEAEAELAQVAARRAEEAEAAEAAEAGDVGDAGEGSDR
jgi:multicomponent Na+:H+ antiporter subunit C